MKTNQLTVVAKETFAEGVYWFKMELTEQIQYTPGQFVVLRVGAKVFRSYSIVSVEHEPTPMLELLIDVRIGGPASQFFEAAKPGIQLDLIGQPLGKFVLRPSQNLKIFIATGTGLAPFIPMIHSLLEQDAQAHIKLYFGVRHLKDDYCERFFPDYNPDTHPHFERIHCLSRPEDQLPETKAGHTHVAGRVTQVVAEHFPQYPESDFYLCGNPAMVDDMQSLLHEHGVDKNIFVEKY